MPHRVQLELCIASVADARHAERGGADRLELNSAIELGGLTPSHAMLRAVKQATHLPVFVMIRPRPGNFVYDGDEFEIMVADARHVIDNGADGIVFGCLTADGEIDLPRCTALVRQAHPRPAVFHRAFDETADPVRALEQLIGLDFHRILTSGHANTALEGASLLAQLIRRAGDRIEILPGGGVRADNVQALFRQTGCNQIHTSLRGPNGTPPTWGEVDGMRRALDHTITSPDSPA